MKRDILIPAILALAVSAATLTFVRPADAAPVVVHHHGAAAAPADTSAVAARSTFRAEMRRLWEDHIVWTREVIVGILGGTPDTQAALTRLLRNQRDIGDAIKPFYGAAAGDRLTALLTDHILIAGRILTLTKAGDTAGADAASVDWYANGHDIAVFLASANPHWALADLDAAMRTHLATTFAEAQARVDSNWTADVAAYDAVHAHILVMSDVLADGIIAQFPASFAR